MTGVLLLLKRLARRRDAGATRGTGEAQAGRQGRASKTSAEPPRSCVRRSLTISGSPARSPTSRARSPTGPASPSDGNSPPNSPQLDPNVELVLYRVAQEGLTNAARHSGASEVSLTLEHDDDSVVLRVIDNGRGFDGTAPPKAAACAASASAR